MKQKFVSYTETKISILEVIVSLFSLKLTIVGGGAKTNDLPKNAP